MRSTPGCVEGRLHARDHAQVREERKTLVIGHLQVFEAMTGRTQRVAPHFRGGQAKAVRHDPRRAVADDVEARLLARQGRCSHVSGDVLCREVRRACRDGLRIHVGSRQACGVRADRAVDEEVARRASSAEVTDRLLPVELPPVANDLGHRVLAAEFQRVQQVFGAADRRPSVLVEARDPACGSGMECRSLRSRALLGIHGPERCLAQGVMCRPGHRAFG